MLPFLLLSGFFGLGSGFISCVPTFSVASVAELTLKLLSEEESLPVMTPTSTHSQGTIEYSMLSTNGKIATFGSATDYARAWVSERLKLLSFLFAVDAAKKRWTMQIYRLLDVWSKDQTTTIILPCIDEADLDSPIAELPPRKRQKVVENSEDGGSDRQSADEISHQVDGDAFQQNERYKWMTM